MRLSIQKLVHGGQGLAYTADNQTAFVWNALPGEEVEADILHKKHGVYEAVATQILNPSQYRQAPREDFYLSTAPWQIMQYQYENEQKKIIAQETYNHIGLYLNQEINISAPDVISGYRNKMEYSFYSDEAGEWHLAFFNRGSHRKRPTGTSVLASSPINSVANQIVELIRAAKVEPKTLKSLILRSNSQGEVLFGIFIKDKHIQSSLPLAQLAEISQAVGFKVYYSRPTSPASTTDELLHQHGVESLTTTICGFQLSYGLMSFFQVNEPAFETALTQISHHLPPSSTAQLLDYFSGVGAISICLADKIATAIQIESNTEAVEFAKLNIAANNLSSRFQAHALLAEAADQFITPQNTLILDPPRAGLHSKTIQRILAAQPPQIIYMSCNIATHARDLQLLSEKYQLSNLQIFNFFPQTPHIEGLAVLQPK